VAIARTPSGHGYWLVQALLDYNRRFHLTLARASRNERLARLIERTLDEMMRPIAIGYPADEHGEKNTMP